MDIFSETKANNNRLGHFDERKDSGENGLIKFVSSIQYLFIYFILNIIIVNITPTSHTVDLF